MKKKIFVICPVRQADRITKVKLEEYTRILEEEGNCEVHLPHRDTNQKNSSFGICSENLEAIKNADEVHVCYNSKSQGIHFDMGVAFALGKKVVIIQNELFGIEKSFAQLLDQWQKI